MGSKNATDEPEDAEKGNEKEAKVQKGTEARRKGKTHNEDEHNEGMKKKDEGEDADEKEKHNGGI